MLVRVATKKKINVSEDVEKRKHSCTVEGTVTQLSHCGKQYACSSQNYK